MELFTFARFHTRPGEEGAMEEAIREGLTATRTEPGCVSTHAYRSTRDPRLFFIYSRWKDEAALEIHVNMPYTVRFFERAESLIDHPFDATRTVQIV